MISRRALATLLALAPLVASLTSSAQAVQALPEYQEYPIAAQETLVSPVVPLDNFFSESSWRGRWQRSHAERVAQGTMIETDRPTFTLAPTTVPQGWVQLETGFITTSAENSDIDLTWNSFPQMNLRIGILPRVEFRALWGGTSTTSVTDKSSNDNFRYVASSSTEFGLKFQVSQQRGWIPQSALVTDVIVPTGDFYGAPFQLTAFYAWNSVSPLIDYIYFWRLGERFSFGGSSGWIIGTHGGMTVDHFFQSAVLKYHWTPRLTWFTEYYYVAADQYYGGPNGGVDTGLKWRFFNNAQLDWVIGRPGIEDGNGYFTGVGFSFRY